MSEPTLREKIAAIADLPGTCDEARALLNAAWAAAEPAPAELPIEAENRDLRARIAELEKALSPLISCNPLSPRVRLKWDAWVARANEVLSKPCPEPAWLKRPDLPGLWWWWNPEVEDWNQVRVTDVTRRPEGIWVRNTGPQWNPRGKEGDR